MPPGVTPASQAGDKNLSVRTGSGAGLPEVRQRDRASADRLVRQPDPATLARLVHRELVVEAEEVLLHRGLGDDELLSDLADRRRLGEEVGGQDRPAQRNEHVALATG